MLKIFCVTITSYSCCKMQKCLQKTNKQKNLRSLAYRMACANLLQYHIFDTDFSSSKVSYSNFKVTRRQCMRFACSIKWYHCKLYIVSDVTIHWTVEGAQLLSGRVLDSRLRVRWFEPHVSLCCVLEQSKKKGKAHLSLLSTGLTQEDPSRHNWKLLTGM